jgi:hypothetical protein
MIAKPYLIYAFVRFGRNAWYFFVNLGLIFAQNTSTATLLKSKITHLQAISCH